MFVSKFIKCVFFEWLQLLDTSYNCLTMSRVIVKGLPKGVSVQYYEYRMQHNFIPRWIDWYCTASSTVSVPVPHSHTQSHSQWLGEWDCQWLSVTLLQDLRQLNWPALCLAICDTGTVSGVCTTWDWVRFRTYFHTVTASLLPNTQGPGQPVGRLACLIPRTLGQEEAS